MRSELTHSIAFVALPLALTAAEARAWEPSKPVEIIVAAGAGGASDQMARMMQCIARLSTASPAKA